MGEGGVGRVSWWVREGWGEGGSVGGGSVGG